MSRQQVRYLISASVMLATFVVGSIVLRRVLSFKLDQTPLRAQLAMATKQFSDLGQYQSGKLPEINELNDRQSLSGTVGLEINEFSPTALFTQTIQSEETPFLNLTFQLTVPRQQYVLGEVVEFTVELSNQTDTPLPGHAFLKPEDDFLQMHIANADGAIKDYKGGSWGTNDTIYTQGIVAAGDRISETATIYFNRSTPRIPDQYLAFPKNDTYFLQAALKNIGSPDLLLSNIVRIEVVQPTGSDEIVWKQLRQYETAIAYQKIYDGGFDIDNLPSVLKQFPNSIYARNIEARFGELQSKLTKQDTDSQSILSNRQRQTSITIDNQQILVNVEPSASAVNETIITTRIVPLVNQWVDAWNSRDFDSYAQLHSRQTKTWQDWQSGPESRLYYKQNQRMQSLFSAMGTVMVEIIGFTVGTEEIVVNVIPSFTGQQLIFNNMHFVQDEDGVWRLAAPQ
jgi:hypothetical protein